MSWRKGQAYGQDLRDLVLAAPGWLREVAERFGVSASYVSRARSRLSRPGQCGRTAQSCPAALGRAEGAAAGAGGLGARADAGAVVPVGQGRARHCSRADDHGQDFGPGGADARKTRCTLEEQERADVAQARADWRAQQSALATAGRLVFLDETWATTNMAPTRGRSPRLALTQTPLTRMFLGMRKRWLCQRLMQAVKSR